jgi:hypothetical protein
MSRFTVAVPITHRFCLSRIIFQQIFSFYHPQVSVNSQSKFHRKEGVEISVGISGSKHGKRRENGKKRAKNWKEKGKRAQQGRLGKEFPRLNSI